MNSNLNEQQKKLRLTIYSMNETRFQCNKKYQHQCYSTRTFTQSPCYCSYDQHFSFFSLWNIESSELWEKLQHATEIIYATKKEMKMFLVPQKFPNPIWHQYLESKKYAKQAKLHRHFFNPIPMIWKWKPDNFNNLAIRIDGKDR